MTQERWRMVQGTAVLVAALVLQASPGEARMVRVVPSCGVCTAGWECPDLEEARDLCLVHCNVREVADPYSFVCDDDQYGCEPGQFWTNNWWCDVH